MVDQTAPQDITPEQFAQLVAGANDEEIATTIRSAGTGDVLKRIFEGMEERFVPDKAQGVDATIQFVVTDEDDNHAYAVSIADGSCRAERAAAEDPRVTITTDVVNFAKLVAGQAQGPQLFMAGKLRVAGDLMFSTRVMTFFDRPQA
ncbi:MAG: SCP2 sterol-binding domain-containing protein [Actinomycetota bacterium]